MKLKLKSLLPILLLTLIPTLLIWAPFFFRLKSFWTIPLPENGMATIVANYDGPLFMVVSKTLYNIDAIKTNFSFPLPTQYYAAHFPIFPLLIKLVGTLTNYPYAMLAVTLASSLLAIYFFKLFISDYVAQKDVLWMTAIFSILPARWLVVRSVGSAEPLFVAAIIASIYYFKNKSYLLAGIWGVVAQLTKSPGILLFFAYITAIIVPNFKRYATTSFSNWAKSIKLKRLWPILLIPASLIVLFFVYAIKFNDFLAYFNSGDNIHLFFPPFAIFNSTSAWVGTFWLEEIIFVYLFGILGLMRLIKQKQGVITWFVGIFFITTLFVAHRDVIRYSLPMIPFILAAFSNVLTKWEFKIAMAVIILPIYLFAISYISQNVMPISDWSPFL